MLREQRAPFPITLTLIPTPTYTPPPSTPHTQNTFVVRNINLVPSLLVLSPMKTERMSFPKLAAFTASILLAAQCLR